MINFRSKLHQKLFGHYFANPDKEHYVRELSKIISFDATHLSRELNLLTHSGVFTSRMRDREKYFRLNRNHPLYNEFRKIIAYTVAEKATNKKIS